MKNIKDIDNLQMLQLLGDMNLYIDRWCADTSTDDADYATRISDGCMLNARFAELTGEYPDDIEPPTTEPSHEQ